MGNTTIGYADQVSNPLQAFDIETNRRGTFCEKPDPEGTCPGCWAEAMNKRFGNGLAFDRSNRHRIEWRRNEKEMKRMQRLNSVKPSSGKFPGQPLVIFTNDTYDLFQPSITDTERDWVFDIYDDLTNLTLLIQSTYVARMWAYLCKRYNMREMPKQYFIGMSAGTQKFLDDNCPHLLDIPAPRRYVILEPIVEAVNLDDYLYTRFIMGGKRHMHNKLDLVIVGGESGTGARACDIQWVRQVVQQCKVALVSVFVKQLGTGRKKAGVRFQPNGDGRVTYLQSKGERMEEWPQELRVRQMPEVPA